MRVIYWISSAKKKFKYEYDAPASSEIDDFCRELDHYTEHKLLSGRMIGENGLTKEEVILRVVAYTQKKQVHQFFMANVYYSPDAVEQNVLSPLTDNIKDGHSPEDLLLQVLLDWGVDLTLPITHETIAGREIFFVDGNALAACFEKDRKITEDFCKELAKRQPLRVVFRDSGFKDDSAKINAEQIFKLMSPHTEVKTL